MHETRNASIEAESPVRHPAIALELGALVGGGRQGERASRPAASVGELTVEEELDLDARVALVAQLRVDVLVQLPQAPHALIERSAARIGHDAILPAGVQMHQMPFIQKSFSAETLAAKIRETLA